MAAHRSFKVWLKPLSAALCLTALAGCYHAVIETGMPPTEKTKKMWMHSWLYGLVPPAVVKAQSECENGVARVETQLSFVNQVVGAVTFGIYTPMEIVVTCAAPVSGMNDADTSAVVAVEAGADYAKIMSAFTTAADIAVEREQPAYVVFR